MSLPKLFISASVGTACLVNFACAALQEVAPQETNAVTQEVIVDELDYPIAIGFHPSTGQIFIAESGAGRVIRVVDGKSEPAITDFPLEKSNADPAIVFGPLSLLFIDAETLLVGGGGLPNGADNLSVYKIPVAGAEPILADAKQGEPKSLPATDNQAAAGDFSCFVQSPRGVYVLGQGDDEQSLIGLAKLEGGTLLDFTRFISLEKTTAGVASAFTISPEGYVAVCQLGEPDNGANCALTFLEAQSGKVVKSFNTTVDSISGLTYGPQSGRLFAIHANLKNPSDGQLLKIIGTEDGCRCETILKLERPTALAFSPKGDLYVALAGDPLTENPSGKLIRIKGLDQPLSEIEPDETH